MIYFRVKSEVDALLKGELLTRKELLEKDTFSSNEVRRAILSKWKAYFDSVIIKKTDTVKEFGCRWEKTR